MLRPLLAFLFAFLNAIPVYAQPADLQSVLQENRPAIERASRKTLQPVLVALIESGVEGVQPFLENWRQKNVWQRRSDGLVFLVKNVKATPVELLDLVTGLKVGEAEKVELKNLKPNSGVRSIIASALVRFQLVDPDPVKRQRALDAISRSPDASHLAVLRETATVEEVASVRARSERLERLLTIRFDDDESARIAAIRDFAGDTDVEVRAVLNPVLAVKREVSTSLPGDANIAKRLVVGDDIAIEEAYDMLVDADLAPQRVSRKERDAALVENIRDGKVGGFPVASLDSEAVRDLAFEGLINAGTVSPMATGETIAASVGTHVFYERYLEPSRDVTDAALETLNAINASVSVYKVADLTLDGLSLASIYFLAAIGLAITFGVMGVINMAHGEFIMIGAYTGYVVQQFIPDHTLSIIIAFPLAFGVAFLAGVVMERMVIRHLMHRPLETLLATFGISIALQQLTKTSSAHRPVRLPHPTGWPGPG